jgi:hypothetical protein
VTIGDNYCHKRKYNDAFRHAEIAAALGPSEGTIKNHVSSILAKLLVRDRMRAVLRDVPKGRRRFYLHLCNESGS